MFFVLDIFCQIKFLKQFVFQNDFESQQSKNKRNVLSNNLLPVDPSPPPLRSH